MNTPHSHTRPYEPYAYTDALRAQAFWPDTVATPEPLPSLEGDVQAEFAIIGAGFAGLAAALRLAEAGADVAVLEARTPGWGASGRNGGLVSIGSAKISDAALVNRVGQDDATCFFKAERAAIEAVTQRQQRYGIDADQHGDGYTVAAHHPRAIADIKAYGATYASRYGLTCRYLDPADMRAEGMASPDFHGAVRLPLGSAINPMKMHRGLLDAAIAAGVRVYANSDVQRVSGNFELHTPGGCLKAARLLITTNGYVCDDLPGHQNAVLPVQSNILVSRVLTDSEIEAQGWHSDQMVVDSRRLLHYFRLTPDKRMLLGLRGTVRASAASLAATRVRARADFERMFPAWQQVETPYFWSGLIAMSRELLPLAGPIPNLPNAWMACAFHGSGVAMAPYCGELIADLALGQQRLPHPAFLQRAPRRFELGRFRRAVLPAVFAGYGLLDRFGR